MHQLDLADRAHLVHADQRQRQPFGVAPSGSADAVDMDFGVGCHIDVDDGFQAFHVQATRGDIGCHQHRATAVGKLHQHLVAFALLQLAKQGQGAVTLRLQHGHQITALLLGVAKSQRALRPEMRQQFGHGIQSLAFAHLVTNLADFVGAVLRLYLHRLRGAHELRCQLGDAFGVSGRKQQGLPVFGALAHHLGDVIEKAHVQHAVGFIEHQGVHARQTERATLQMVQDAAGRADHHIGAMFEAHGLAAQGHATAQGDHFDVLACAGQAPDFLGDLIGQFARGAQDHGLDGGTGRPGALQALNQRQPECGRFAAASAGLRDQVLPGQGQRQAGGLNGRHLGVAQLLEVLKGGGGQLELVKASRCRGRRGCSHAGIIVGRSPTKTHAVMRIGIVIGPSLTKDTFMSAAKRPVCTSGWAFRACATKCPYR